MALQGTIDAFPLTDVLQLLSSSAKSGRLVVDGDRGRAALWIEQGSVTGGTSRSDAPGATELVFGLLRFGDGSFVFDEADEPPPVPVDPRQLVECIDAATAMLEEWRAIEAVVPSMLHRVGLAPELPDGSVTITAEQWRLLATASGSPTVSEVALGVRMDEFECCAALAALAGQGLVVISEPDGEAGSIDQTHLMDPQPVAEFDADRSDGDFPDHFPIDDLLGTAEPAEGGWADEDSEPQRFAAAQAFEPLGSAAFTPAAFGEPEPDLHDRTAEAWDDVVAAQTADDDQPWPTPAEASVSDSVDDTADEVLRQMSRLSPKAAEAIAAALSGPAPAPHEDVASDERPDEGPVTFMGSF